MYTDTSIQAYQNGVHHVMGPKTLWYQFYKRASGPLGVLVVALVLAIVATQPFVSPETAQMARVASRIAFAIAFVTTGISYVVARVVHKNNTFTLTDDAFKIRRGVFRKEEFAIPYRQIQNIEIERSLVQRILGLSTVIILTAAQEHELSRKDAPESIIPAIDEDIASFLQDELLRRHGTVS